MGRRGRGHSGQRHTGWGASGVFKEQCRGGNENWWVTTWQGWQGLGWVLRVSAGPGAFSPAGVLG